MLVESPAKAKKIQEFLGADLPCRVLASYGHVRDLPPRAGSVDPSNDFRMTWEALQHSEKHMQNLQEAMRQSPSVELLLATDPDREGEAISWHVLDLLRERGVVSDAAENVHRITFTEVTKEAVTAAMSSPRKIDERLVQAYLARRALDYLLGFHLSPILWRKLPGASSAGRVQSVALRMVCEREDEIDGFERSIYWTVHGVIRLPDGSTVRANAVTETGSTDFATLEEAEKVKAALERAELLAVEKVSKKRTSRQPQAPFTTSTLQQESNTKLGFDASMTMQLAQELYEGGMITYIRTDSYSMAPGAVEGIRLVLRTKYGDEYVPSSPKIFARKKSANAQEAHEAIRPTDPSMTPQAVSYKGYGSAAIKLYELIRNRALASQAENAAFDGVAVTFVARGPDQTVGSSGSVSETRIELKATGSKLAFAGYLDVLGRNEDLSSDSDNNYLSLSTLEEGQTASIDSGETTEHATKPPPRYTEGSLIKAMEERGIGRPSTYAPTLKLLYARNYLKSSKKRLHAEPTGRILTSFLKEYAPEYVDYSYTSTLESDFDRISHGDQDWMEVMRTFWSHFEQTTVELSRLSGTEVLDALNENMAPYLFSTQVLDPAANASTNTKSSNDYHSRECPSCKGQLSLKLSHKGGPFIGCSEYPTCTYTRPLPSADEDFVPTKPDDMGNAYKSLNIAEQYGMRGPVRLLGALPGGSGGTVSTSAAAGGPEGQKTSTESLIFVRQGPYGPYIQVGLDKDPSMKRVPLPKDCKPRSLTLKYALSMLELPRTLGDHPDTGAPVEVRNGKFGPFILHGSHMRSIPKDLDPLDLTLDEALNLLKLSSENKKFASSSGKSVERRSSDRVGRVDRAGTSQSKKETEGAEDATTASTAGNATNASVSVPRARSAYQFFLKDHLSKEKMKNGKEKMKIMGKTWKALSDDQRAVFQAMAEDDLLRVRIQEATLIEPTLESWESIDDNAKHALRAQLASLDASSYTTTGDRDSSKPSKSTSAYTLFMQDVSEQIKRDKDKGEDVNRGSFMTLVAKQWRSLPETEREKYFRRAEQGT